MKKITSRKKLALYGCSGLGVNMLNIIVGSYLCSALLVGGFDAHVESWTYLNRDLVVAGLWATFVFVAKVLDGIIDLPLASFADRLTTKLGRRKTAILLGFFPMIVSYLLFLIPINSNESILNTIWFGVLLCIFYTSYTLTMLTYYATFSEVTQNERDTVFLSNTKSVCDVVYFALGFALVPLFVSLDINIRYIAIMFLPLVLTMMIPMFLLHENEAVEVIKKKTLSFPKALGTSFKNKAFIIWMTAASAMTVGSQLFLGGINELFSSTGLNMSLVMASSFAPVPLTIFVYNKIVKRFGLGVGYRFVLTIFSIGMIIMYFCNINSANMTELALTLVAVLGGIFVSFAIGAFFSVTYTVPTALAQMEYKKSGKLVANMYFAVEGLFEGIAAGIATGPILVFLKDNKCISWLPIIVSVSCAVAFGISFAFPRSVKTLGKLGTDESATEAALADVTEES